MKPLFIIAVIATVSFLAVATQTEEESVVIDLSGVDLTTWLKSHPVALVFFFVPWSPDCRKLLPMFDMLSPLVTDVHEDIVFAKIDCTVGVSKEFCLPYVDAGFPTFTVFRDGRPWSRAKNSGLSDEQILEEDLHDERNWNKMAVDLDDPEFDAADVVAPFTAPLRKAIADLATIKGEADDAQSEDVGVADTSEDRQSEGKSTFVDDITGVDFGAWLKQNPMALILFYSPRSPQCQKLLPMFNAFAGGIKPMEEDVTFAQIDCTNAASKEACLPYVEEDFPIVVVYRDGHPWSRELNPETHPMGEQDVYSESVWNRAAAENKDPNFDAKAFTADFMAPLKKAMTDLPSAMKEKEQEDKYPVDDVTGVEFSAWLKRNPVALVMFYSPRSINYRTLLPLYGAYIAGLKSSNAKVTTAKIDCTAVGSKKACLPYFNSDSPTFTVFRDGQPWTGGQSDDLIDEDAALSVPFMAPMRKAMAELDALGKEKAAESQLDDEYFEDVVVYLNGYNFSDQLNRHAVSLVMFYSPISPDYRRVTSFFDTFAKVLHETYPDTMFAKIDCSVYESEDICDEHTDYDLLSFAVFKNNAIYQNAYKTIPEERLKETWYLEALHKTVDMEFPDLQDAEFVDPFKNALTSLVGVHLEMVVGKPRKTRREEL